ncbi:MAG: penicillin acylase family protein, partial [bacterium]|nr:penicillin acylase family protein [bacterium]
GDVRFVYGFSRWLAWGGSTYRSAASDMYIEKVRVSESGEPTHYLFKDEWLPVARRETTLRVAAKGGGFSSLVLPIFSTRHGGSIPLTEGTGAFYTRLKGGPKIRWAEERDGQHYAYAMRGTMAEEPNQLTAAMELYRSHSLDQMREVYRKNYLPIFAALIMDREGEVYYQHLGRVPIRENAPEHEFNQTGHWIFPYRGWLDEGRWKGMVKFEDLPWHDTRKMGPPRDGYMFFAAQVNPPVADMDKYPPGLFYYSRKFPRFVWHMPPARWISQYYMHDWFRSRASVSAADLWGLISDPYSPLLGWMKPKLIEAYEKRGDTLDQKYRETARKAVELIKQSP